MQVRHLLEPRVVEEERIEAEIADLRLEVTEHLEERLRITGADEPDEIGEARAAIAEAGPDESFRDVLRAADEALLAAKRSGRDRILIASSIRD